MVNQSVKLTTIFGYSRAWFYCKACHEDIKDENLIRKCKCKNCKYPFKIKVRAIKTFFAAVDVNSKINLIQDNTMTCRNYCCYAYVKLN